MAHPVCSICRHPNRAAIDADLLKMSASATGKKHGLNQPTLSKHLREHLKPHATAIAWAKAALPDAPPPPTTQIHNAALIPTVGALLADLGHTVKRLKKLADDAEADGGLGIRALSLRELRSGLADATKLVSVLALPPAPPAEQIDRSALADLFASADVDTKSAILERLLP